MIFCPVRHGTLHAAFPFDEVIYSYVLFFVQSITSNPSLQYGAPGSGKTSFIHSIAGELGLDVYVISLSRVGLDDSALGELVNELPERCIALMEDIDAAFTHGLNRDGPAAQNTDASGKQPAAPGPAAAPTTTSRFVRPSRLTNNVINQLSTDSA